MKRIKATLNEDNVKFFCNEKKGVVVCKITSNLGHIPVLDGKFSFIDVEGIGKAVCGKDDKYDEVKGRQIAESRAKVELYRKIKEVIIELKHQLFNEEMDLANQKSRYERLIEKEKLHIEELVQ
jgi:hypothetical protein